MKIIVLVKQVPDTWGDRVLDEATGMLDRAASDPVLDEIGERAVEVALRVKDADKSTEVVVLSMGPRQSTDTLRKALAMGADSAIHVLDDGLAGADLMTTASVLAAAVAKAGFDLVVAGNESTDGRGGVVPAMIAEKLGVPSATFLGDTVVSAGRVSGVREDEDGSATVHATLPAVVSITEAAAEARFPNFRGIMQAKKKPLVTWTRADLGPALGAPARSVVTSTVRRPERAAGVKIVDDGSAGVKVAEFLSANRLL